MLWTKKKERKKDGNVHEQLQKYKNASNINRSWGLESLTGRVVFRSFNLSGVPGNPHVGPGLRPLQLHGQEQHRDSIPGVHSGPGRWVRGQDWCVLFWLPTCERVKSGGPRLQEIAGNRSAAGARANGNGLICNSQRDKSHHHNCRPVIQPGLISNSSGLIYLRPTRCLFLKYPLIYGSAGPIHNSAVQLSLVQIELPGLQRKASGRRGKKADLMRGNDVFLRLFRHKSALAQKTCGRGRT